LLTADPLHESPDLNRAALENAKHDLDVVDSSYLGKKGVKVRENLTMREVHFPVGGDNLFFA
jgi:hypothetical protein